jgi:hypothetical protein
MVGFKLAIVNLSGQQPKEPRKLVEKDTIGGKNQKI